LSFRGQYRHLEDSVYTLGGLFAGLAGIVVSARLTLPSPLWGRDMNPMLAVIGGTPAGGGAILGTVIGRSLSAR
jgi:inositol transport system permease protein